MAKLKKAEQGSRIMEEFVQEFKWAVGSSKYEKQTLIKEFKRVMNMIIR